ncbi:hypothetical protein [Sulfurimonas sp.]|uniref:hypothetical protein n=1 Tax=Sulfurimonas sp. TaxID=2022749 RepID=UPI002B4823AA|nr:hypothetical protein [Sulfurimonas sp.]
MKLTINEYSKQFKMSKEIINSKIKSKRLNYIIEDSTTYIIISDATNNEEIKTEVLVEKALPLKPKTTVATVIALYQRENTQLKERIMQLEIKIDKLIDDKEQMLRDERDKIEELYSNKDKQLKNILELINTKMISELQNETVHEVEHIQQQTISLELVELKEHLKTLNLKSYQRKIIKKRFIAAYDNDDRILQKDGKLYLDFSKYDYNNLLAY